MKSGRPGTKKNGLNYRKIPPPPKNPPEKPAGAGYPKEKVTGFDVCSKRPAPLLPRLRWEDADRKGMKEKKIG